MLRASMDGQVVLWRNSLDASGDQQDRAARHSHEPFCNAAEHEPLDANQANKVKAALCADFRTILFVD